METVDTKTIKKSSKIKRIDIIYLTVIFIFFILVIILFINSTSFIIKNINNIFSQAVETESNALNIERYNLISKKLNLPINDQNDKIVKIEEQKVEIEAVKVEEEQKTEEEAIVDKKQLLTINIINAAKKEGVATVLSKKLEDSGFPKSVTSTSIKLSPSTTISIKESQKEYTSLIIDIVKKSYPKATTKVNPEDSKYDVVITIGK